MKRNFIKYLLVVFCICTAHSQLFAQAAITLGPDIALPCDSTCVVLTATVTGVTGSTSSYTLDSTGITYPSPYPYVIPGETQIPYDDDIYSDTITLPFSFCFYGISYTQLLIGTNSDIVFDLSLAGLYDPWPIDDPIPSNTYSSPAIMGCYGDWETSRTFPISYIVEGTAPNRVFIENITTYEFDVMDKQVRAQVVLHETTNIIDVYIQQRDVYTSWNDGDYITGIQKSSTVALAFPGHNQTTWGGDSLDKAYRFIPSGAPTVYLLSSTGTVLQTVTNPDSVGVGVYTVAFAPVCPATSPLNYIAEVEACSSTVLYDTVRVTSGSAITPVAHSNSPICSGGTLSLTATGDPTTVPVVYNWTGPDGFTSTLQNPTILAATSANSGIYSVTATYGGCTSLAGTVTVTVTSIPAAPVAGSNSPVCSGNALNLTAVSDSGATYSWSGPGGFTSATQDPTIYAVTTPQSGVYSVFATVNGCVSPLSTETVVIDSTPVAPVASSNSPVCSGNTLELTATDGTDSVHYSWTGPDRFTSVLQNPTILHVSTAASGTYVAIAKLGICSSSSITVVQINPTPALPVLHSNAPLCFGGTLQLRAIDTAGVTYIWTGPASFVSIAQNPVIAPANTTATGIYSVTATLNGCVSPLATESVTVLPLPLPPVTADLKYCQFAQALPLTAIGDSLRWYFNGVHIDSTPVPPTNYVPAGNYENLTTWYVTQSVDSLGVTCQSDSGQLTVTTIFQPNFTITPSSAFVCQFDSINIAYTGEYLYAPDYTWVLPNGARVVDGTDTFGMPSIVVQFDSGLQLNYVYLTATDDSGFCSTRDSIPINVVETPFAATYSKNDVCLGDTTTLALSYESYDAAEYSWKIDGTPLESSHAVNIIYSNSNSSGPYSVTWNDTGLHVIELNTFTKEGCASKPFYDSINVKATPNASFIYKVKNETFCIQDSVLFIAIDSNNYSDAYLWGPSSDFNNVNTPTTWGKVMDNPTVITLTVTDPFGCTASSSMTLQPGSCCTANFPSAFTPNNDGKNDFFRPIFPDSSIHTYHEFRIANRWGQTIFESESTGAQWDGTFGGVPQDMGVYYYYIKFDCGGNTIQQSGNVTLIR